MSCPPPSAIRCPSPRTLAHCKQPPGNSKLSFLYLPSPPCPPHAPAVTPLQPDPWKGSGSKGAGITRKKTFKEVAK